MPIRSKQAATSKVSQLSDYGNTLDPKHQMQSQSATLQYEADADAIYTQLDDIETEVPNCSLYILFYINVLYIGRE